jgi:hypothetical protein
MPRAHFAYDQLDGRSHGWKVLNESLHSGFSAAANGVQRRSDRLVFVELCREAPWLVTGDGCLDGFAWAKFAKRAP